MEPLSLSSLDARIRLLEDREAITALRMRYHYFINEGLFDRFDELYTDDAVVDFGTIARAVGIAQIRTLFLQIPAGTDLVKQFVHNHMIELNGDHGRGLSYLEARYAKNGESIMAAGSYREAYRRTASGWKISETILSLFFAVPLSLGWAGSDLQHIKPLT